MPQDHWLPGFNFNVENGTRRGRPTRRWRSAARSPWLSRRSRPRSGGRQIRGAERWIALTNVVVGEGRALYEAVVDADLEAIAAKHLADAYHPKLARWHKVLNRGYSQRRGRAEWFPERRGR
jgi:hypothetical protein